MIISFIFLPKFMIIFLKNFMLHTQIDGRVRYSYLILAWPHERHNRFLRSPRILASLVEPGDIALLLEFLGAGGRHMYSRCTDYIELHIVTVHSAVQEARDNDKFYVVDSF